MVTLFGQNLDIDEDLSATAKIFGILLFVALMAGFLLGNRKRVWCRHLCPIGSLLGTFSRLGAVQFVPSRRLGNDDVYTDKGICPTMIDIAHKTESRHCIECCRCVNPSAKGSIRMRFRWPGEEVETIADHSPALSEVLMLFLTIGIVLGNFLWESSPFDAFLQTALADQAAAPGWSWLTDAGPYWLTGEHPWTRFFSILLCMIACSAFFISVMLAMTGLATRLAMRRGGYGTFRRQFIVLGYQYVPVALASLPVGFGQPLFDLLDKAFPSVPLGKIARVFLLLAGMCWSLYAGNRILRQMGIRRLQRWLPMLPGLICIFIIGVGWWTVIFGM